MEYEIMLVKLEVERVRLEKWGDTISLGDLEQDNTPGTPPTIQALPPDSPLRQRNVIEVVKRVLGCIQHVFKNTQELESIYGLRPTAPISAATDRPPFLLAAIFAKPYANLRGSGRYRQASTPIGRRTRWAVHDARRFQALVAEIRGYNDSLDVLFPGSGGRVAEDMRLDVERSVDVAELQLLQGAVAGDLSESASARLEVLGAPAHSMRSELLTSVPDDATIGPEEPPDNASEGSNNDTGGSTTAQQTDDPLSEMERRIERIERFREKKEIGALTLSVSGAWQYSTRVTAHCYWSGEPTSRSVWTREEHGYVRSSHAAYGTSSFQSRGPSAC
jgi:hypothetical protein